MVFSEDAATVEDGGKGETEEDVLLSVSSILEGSYGMIGSRRSSKSNLGRTSPLWEIGEESDEGGEGGNISAMSDALSDGKFEENEATFV